MWLADTSVWIEHLRAGSPDLADRLSEGRVLIHSFIIGELACGSLKNRAVILADLKRLPPAITATDDEVMQLLEDRKP
jgi:predicted nucleic acid-binding protein